MTTKGTRLPDSWRPNDTLLAWAKKKRPDLSDCMEEVVDDFIDYWTSETGANACKLDWDRTFKNFLRRCFRPKTAPPLPQRGRYQNTSNADWDGVVL